MADNYAATPGSGLSFAADEVGAVLHPRIKISVGADGEAADLDHGQAAMAASLPVVIASNQSAVPVTVGAGTSNIGDVDVLTVPAPLSTTGGGTEATALRVTVATDSTGVLSVDDNGGALTVDGAVTVTGAAADDAAASGNPVSIGGLYQATVDEVDDGDVGRLRMTARRAVVSGSDFKQVYLNSVTPAPAGSDIVDSSIGAIESGDLAIRDTDDHDFLIPMTINGWRSLSITLWGTNLNQDLVCSIKLNGYSVIASFTLPAAAYVGITLSGLAGGQGGTVGAATASTSAHYSVPAINSPASYIYLSVKASVAPSAGALSMIIERGT